MTPETYNGEATMITAMQVNAMSTRPNPIPSERHFKYALLGGRN